MQIMDGKIHSNRFFRHPKIPTSRRHFVQNSGKNIFDPEMFYRRASNLRKVFGIEQDLNNELKFDLKLQESKKNPVIRKKHLSKQFSLILDEDFSMLPPLNYEIYNSQRSIRLDKPKAVNENLLNKPKISLKKTSLPVITKRRSSIENLLKNESISGW
jgi:hypothetical protein